MKKLALIFCLGTLHAGISLAGPADYVSTPGVEYGEREIDFKHGFSRLPDGTRTQTTSLGFGYGATESWFTEFYLKRDTEGDDRVNIAEWENRFQLTEPGKYALDVGLLTEFEAPLNNANAPYEFRFGPLLQTELGKFQLNGNVLFQRKLGHHVDGDAPFVTELGYQWQVKYRWLPTFEFGAQGIGEVGQWDHWDDRDKQFHRVGPAVFGKFGLGNRRAIKYNAALLYGVSAAAAAHTFRLQAEYEF